MCDYASSTAAIAYNYNVTCCRRYEPFANVFKALDGRWEVVASSESLQRSMERTGKEFSERKIILLRNGQYDLHDTADIIEIALVALENRSDVTINCNNPLLRKKCFFHKIAFTANLRGVFSEGNVSFPNMVLAEVSSNHCVQNDNGQKSFKPAAVMTHCVFCFRRDLKLKTCKRCMTATYCGKNCQKLHWQKHQYTCKATGQRNTIEVKVAEGFPN